MCLLCVSHHCLCFHYLEVRLLAFLKEIETNKVKKEYYLMRDLKQVRLLAFLKEIETNKVKKEYYLMRDLKQVRLLAF